MGKKLLVADDSITIQKVIKLALSSEGYEIIAVSGGKEAIQTIQLEKPDVVLLDVSLPESDAYSVKRTINDVSTLKDVRFVVMYSAFEKVDEHAAEEVGFHGRLIKPFDPSHLRKIVAELMAQKSNAAAPPQQPIVAAPLPPLPPAPPPMPLPPALPKHVAVDEDDLPPVQDMHPIVEAEEVPLSLDADEALELESPTEMLDLAALTKRQLEPIDEVRAPTDEPNTGSFSHTLDIELPTPERTKFTERFEPVRQDPPPLTMVEPPRREQDNKPSEMEAVAASKDLENDIRNLTDSTIQMTGLDAFSWNVDDSKKMKKPEEIVRRSTTDTNTGSGFIQISSKPIDDGGSTFLSASSSLSTLKPPIAAVQPPLPPPPQAAPPPPVQKFTNPALVTPSPAIVSAVPVAPAAATITRAEIEALIRKDLEGVLEKIIREVVPRMAEDLLRKEIDKILSEP